MTTQITKKYYSGFFLTEQELRRIFQEMHDHAEKAFGSDTHSEIQVILKSGAILDIDSADEIFCLENAGRKRVKEVFFSFTAENSLDKHFGYTLSVADTEDSGYDATIRFYVCGDSRDWVFIGASEMEERIKKIRRFSLLRFVRGRYAILVGMAFAPMGMILSSFLWSHEKVYLKLQHDYDVGKLRDPVLALIELEKLRSGSLSSMFMPLFVGFAGPLALATLLAIVFPYFYPPYNFYWGDYKELYKKRMRVSGFIWVAVVLSVVLSLVGNYLSKRIGI